MATSNVALGTAYECEQELRRRIPRVKGAVTRAIGTTADRYRGADILNAVMKMAYGDDLALQEMDRIKNALGNLLAVIHHDGGQYISKHGLLKAIKDAEKLVVKERELFDAYKYQMSGYDRR